MAGMNIGIVPVNDRGEVDSHKYEPTLNGQRHSTEDDVVRSLLKRVTIFKSNDGAYRNTITSPDYVEWVAADNVGTNISGSASNGTLVRGLFVGTSLNNRNPKQVPMRHRRLLSRVTIPVSICSTTRSSISPLWKMCLNSDRSRHAAQRRNDKRHRLLPGGSTQRDHLQQGQQVDQQQPGLPQRATAHVAP
jgi:hypothetical protein